MVKDAIMQNFTSSMTSNVDLRERQDEIVLFLRGSDVPDMQKYFIYLLRSLYKVILQSTRIFLRIKIKHQCSIICPQNEEVAL